MGRTFPFTGAVLFRGLMTLSAIAAAAGTPGTASASPVTYDDILRNCSSAAQIIAQGVTHKDEHMLTDSALGDWHEKVLSHVDAFAGSGEIDAYSEQLSSVQPGEISFMGEARLGGVSIRTPALSADGYSGTFLTVFFTVLEPVHYVRGTLGSVSGLFLHEEAPFGEITEPSGVLAPGKYSINAGVARRLDDDGPGWYYGEMRLRFTEVPGPGGAMVMAGLGALVGVRRRRSA